MCLISALKFTLVAAAPVVAAGLVAGRFQGLVPSAAVVTTAILAIIASAGLGAWLGRRGTPAPTHAPPEPGTSTPVPAMDALAGRVAGLRAAARSLTSTSADLMTSAEKTSERAQSVAAAAEQVGANISTVAAGAEEMTAAIKEISTTTHEAAAVSATAATRSRQVDEAVQRLGKSSADIGSVVKAIAAIAEQTNLLALNATIEAARAGEAGRGFAVVASEVKQLARQTATATEDVGKRIAAIQDDSGTATAALAEIAKLIGRINELQQTSASAVEEQTATTAEMSRNIAEAAIAAKGIAQDIAAVADAVRTGGSGAMAVHELGNRLAAEADALGQPAGASTTGAGQGMDALVWGPRFFTGHGEIDAQHQELFNKVASLHAAMREGKGRKIIGELLVFLAAYTEEHFTAEESILQKAGYATLPQHQKLHHQLLAQVGEVKRRFDAGEALKTMEVSEFLADWLRTHILGHDHAYIPTLKKAGMIR